MSIATVVPEAMRELPQWIVWKFVGDDDKPKKMPFQTNGEPAKTNDPTTWTDFESALTTLQLCGYEGVGFVFAADDGLCGVDLDGCRDPVSGVVADWAKEVILRFGTYAEVSPSQTGVKLFTLGKCPFDIGKKKPVAMPPVCEKQPGVEIYDKGRFFCVTGKSLKGMSDLKDGNEQLAWLKDTYWGKEVTNTEWETYYTDAAVLERARRYLAKVPPAISGQGGHNQTFRAACVLVLGFGLPAEDAVHLLAEWNQTCKPPWSERDLRHKILDASKQGGQRNYLRNVQPEKWEAIDIPQYAAQPAPTGPRLTTLADAAQAYIEALRNGEVPLVSTGIGPLDDAVGGGFERGELVIVAARPSHGKSAVALQCAHVWTSLGIPTLLISEEMPKLMLGKRTIQYISPQPQNIWTTELPQLEAQLADYAADRAPCIIAESCVTTKTALEQIDKAVDEHKIQAVIIDYCQLLQGEGKNRYDDVSRMSVAMRQITSKHRLLTLMLCQLNRDIEDRPKFVPKMSDLKESGQLEQDADAVVMVVWPWRLDETRNADEFLFFVCKNRNRPISKFTVKCRFEADRQMILAEKDWDKPARHAEFDGHSTHDPDHGDPF